VRYVIERMTMADIPRVIEIEKLAYASPWPPSAYRKELQENRYAHYIVVRDTTHLPADAATTAAEPPRRHFPLSLLSGRPQITAARQDRTAIVGFAGLWLMIDEAHITTIATHPDHRGRGVGELMLAGLIDIGYEIGARHVTLEVRVSNDVAQNLYRKYGFRDAGIRRRYYSDNHEDALIMWTPEIHDPAYRADFLRLRAALATRMEAESERGDTDPSDARPHPVADSGTGQR
jgi:ribosomal-protein-alanine N-acetyltransferase